MSAAEALRRTEAKAFFANERTFLHWMNVAVTIGSIAAALLGIAGHGHKSWGSDWTVATLQVRILAVVMLAVSLFIVVYAAFNFHNRANMLRLKMDGPYDSALLPVIVFGCLVVSLGLVFISSLARLQGWTPQPPANSNSHLHKLMALFLGQ